VRGERGAQSAHRAAALRLLRPFLLEIAGDSRRTTGPFLAPDEAEGLARSLADPGLWAAAGEGGAERQALVAGPLAGALLAAVQVREKERVWSLCWLLYVYLCLGAVSLIDSPLRLW
jgi:hypothetical protein